jgi:hypothetical protein
VLNIERSRIAAVSVATMVEYAAVSVLSRVKAGSNGNGVRSVGASMMALATDALTSWMWFVVNIVLSQHDFLTFY